MRMKCLEYKGLQGMSHEVVMAELQAAATRDSRRRNSTLSGLGASEPFITVEQGQAVHYQDGVWLSKSLKPKKHWSLRLVGFITRIISYPFMLFDSKEPEVRVLKDITKEL